MDETEEMVKLLLSRAKMLSLHCPRCNLPLFQRDKKVVCVRCGEVRVEEEGKGTIERQEKVSEGTMKVLEKKREELLSRLESEKDPKKIVSILDAISKIEETIKNLGK